MNLLQKNVASIVKVIIILFYFILPLQKQLKYYLDLTVLSD